MPQFIRQRVFDASMIHISSPEILDEDIIEILDVLKSGNITQGQKVSEFEKEFAKYCGSKHAIATNNGTSALQVALMAMNLREDEYVVTSPFSFIATANSIVFAGGRPLFSDIDELTYCIDPSKLKHDKSRIIMPVHLYGHPANMAEIMEIAGKNNQKIVWDAAQAHGAKFNDRPLGSFDHVSCFSFYATKNMTTAEGGMIITNDDQIASSARMIRNHGSEKQYYHTVLGHNFRMTDINAALGLSQLKRLDHNISKRRKNASLYHEMLSTTPEIVLPSEMKNCYHSYHQFTIRVKRGIRDKLREQLSTAGIDARIYYPLPIHLQPYYRLTYGYNPGILPHAEEASESVLSLPVHPRLTEEQIVFISESVNREMNALV